MRCHDARRLFGPYWDDESTQAERECLEAHFSTCASCLREYEDLTRVLDTLGTLPRNEASPELLERTLARIRHVPPAPDRLPERRVGWVPATAAAALLIAGGAVALQWTVTLRGPANDRTATAQRTVAPASVASTPASSQVVAGIPSDPDSLFDHAEDVEFVLDPVTLKRGRAAVSRELPGGIRTEQAVVSF